MFGGPHQSPQLENKKKKPKQPHSPKLTDAERYKRFLDTAKAVDASDRSEDFERAFEAVVMKSRRAAPFLKKLP